MKSFTGTSRQGRFEDALTDAIETAKRSIPTDYIEWKLLEVSGKNGGFVLVQELTVTIEVISP